MEISELQKELAATFRWTARLNMHEGVANHFSACVPDSSDFYVNKAGIHFSNMKASDLILVTKENKEELKNKPDIIDPTAPYIHSAIHMKKHLMQDAFFMFTQNMQLPSPLLKILL